MIDVKDLKSRAFGRWAGIFDYYGISVGDGTHGACPICGGKDRFRCDGLAKNGEYICGQCGAGDGLALLQKVKGCTFPEVIAYVSEIVGSVETQTEKPKKSPRDMLQKLWNSSQDFGGANIVAKYLHSRGLVLHPDNVRHAPKCYNSDLKKDMDAMVAKVVDVDGKPVSIHRTYLDGPKKADIESPKKLMPAMKSLQGCAVRLFKPKDNTIGVSEGIETAIACSIIFDIPTWACISSALLESFDPPEGVRKIVIYGDADGNYTGQAAAYKLAKRLHRDAYLVTVEIPEEGDWLDVLNSNQKADKSGTPF